MMKILHSELFESQLKEILKPKIVENFQEAKKFKLYLDTIILNMQTKISKYKVYEELEDENIRLIEYQNYTIAFYIDETNSNYVLLSIF